MTGRNNKNNKLKKNTATGRKANPVDMQMTRVSRPRLSFDGQILNGTGYFTPVATLANIAACAYTVDVSNLSGTGVVANFFQASLAVDLLAMAKLYNEFVYRSVKMHWIPFVSPGVADGGSQMYISYADNAEVIAGTLATATAFPVFTVAKTARNAKFFNSWERFTYDVPLSRRRKSFDVNVNTLSSTDTIDRSVQGMVVVGASSSSAAVTLGQWRVTYELELRNLNVNITT